MPESPVMLEIADGIARVTLDRPDAANAIDVPLAVALSEATARIPEALAAAKRLLRSSLANDLPTQLAEETAAMVAAGNTADGREGVAACP